MSTDAGAHRVGLIPVTLMVSGNIMGSGVFLLPANLASTGGIVIYRWLVTIIGAPALSMVYAKMSSLDSSLGGFCAYTRRCFGPSLDYQTNMLHWLACWIGNIAVVVIGVGYLSYFFSTLRDPLVLTLTCVVVLWIFALLNIIGPKMVIRMQAVAMALALVPIVGIAVFGWFWLCGETYMVAWNASGMNTFGMIQGALNATLWSFIGVESASVAAGVVKSPKRNVSIATMGGVLIVAVYYVLSTIAIIGMIPNAALCVSASPLGNAARMALGNTAGATVPFCAAAGCFGSLGGWALFAGQTTKAAADDGLFPPTFARVNKAGTPVVGLIIVGTLMIIFQFSSMSPSAVKEFGLVSSVSAIFTLVPYLYTCAALLPFGHGYLGKACPVYLLVTFIVFVYCIWVAVGSGAKEVMWSSATLMIITALYALNYNRIHKNPYPPDAPVNNS